MMMTEKRFTLLDGVKKGSHSGIWDNLKQYNQGVGDELWIGEVVGMLNGLSEENEQLKQFKNIAIDYNIPFDKLCSAFEDVLEENEQLKKRIVKLEAMLSIKSELGGLND